MGMEASYEGGQGPEGAVARHIWIWMDGSLISSRLVLVRVTAISLI